MNNPVLNQELEVVNGSDKPARVILEAWGDELTLNPNEKCRVACKLEPGHTKLELEYFDGGIVIWFPDGALAEFSE